VGRNSRKQCSRKRLFLLLAAASVLYAGCASVPAPFFASRRPADRLFQEDNIRESIFRYRINESKSSGPFFLSTNGQDPSASFMARFASPKQTVTKASQSYFKKEPFPGWLRDRSTDGQGISYSVGRISWLSPDQVEVRGGMYCGGLCADGGTYRLEKKQERWVVVEYKVEWVS